MSNHKIKPEKVTRPIQLLAAWLTSLIVVNGAFLTAAGYIESPSWAAGALVAAAIINVPFFLICVFLLQTKFRIKTMGDDYLSKHLEHTYSNESSPSETPNVAAHSKALAEDIIQELGPDLGARREPIERIIQDSQVEWVARRMGGNRTLSELFLRPERWRALIAEWESHDSFRNNVAMLIEHGVITMDSEDYATCKLTGFGRKVAKFAEQQRLLFAQQKDKKEFWEEAGR